MPGTPGRQAVSLPYPWIEGLDKRQQTQIYEDFQALARQGTGTRWATLVIAASDSTTKSKNKADFVCNGSNDSALIQSAVDELTSRDQPGRIVFLEGTYLLTASLEIDIDTDQELVLVGMSSGRSGSNCTLRGPGAGDPAILYNATSLFNATPYPTLGIMDIEVQGGSDTAIEWAHNTYGGIVVDNCEISGAVCINTGNNTLFATGQGIRLTNSTFTASGSHAIHAHSAEGCFIADNVISGGSSAAILTGTQGGSTGFNIIRDNLISGSSGSVGIDMSYDSSAAQYQTHAMTVNNRVSGYTIGIYSRFSNRPFIHGNFVYSCTTGIQVEGGSFGGYNQGVVSGNYLYSCTTGIILTGNNNVSPSVVGNTARSVTTALAIGSNVTGCYEVGNDWGGNTVSDSGSGTVHFSPGVDLTAVAKSRVRKNSTGSSYERHRLNFIEGANITITVADDSTDDEVDITIAGSSAITELDDVPDVNAPSPSAGDVLTWDDTPGEWVALPAGAGSIALDDLSDVNAPAPADQEVLTWDDGAGEWVSQVAVSGVGTTLTVFEWDEGYRSNSTDTYTTTSTSWAELDSTNLRITVPAAVGDVIMLDFSALVAYQDTGDDGFVDVHTIVSGTRTNSVAHRTAVSNSQGGLSAWRAHMSSGGVATSVGGTVYYQPVSGDISGGNVTFSLVFRSQTGGRTFTIHKQANIPLQFVVVNLGQPGVRATISAAQGGSRLYDYHMLR